MCCLLSHQRRVVARDGAAEAVTRVIRIGTAGAATAAIRIGSAVNSSTATMLVTDALTGADQIELQGFGKTVSSIRVVPTLGTAAGVIAPMTIGGAGM